MLKSWFIGLANAAISGATVAISGSLLGIGYKKALVMVGASALVSLGKWLSQHPIPGGAPQN